MPFIGGVALKIVGVEEIHLTTQRLPPSSIEPSRWSNFELEVICKVRRYCSVLHVPLSRV